MSATDIYSVIPAHSLVTGLGASDGTEGGKLETRDVYPSQKTPGTFSL